MKEFSFTLKFIGFLTCAAFLSGNLALAAGPGAQDRDVMEKAKGKKYRNGAEEGELRVQAQLYKPQRKIAPVIDKKETDDNQDHD